jgi:hypothetical protein
LAILPLLAAAPEPPGSFELDQARYERLRRDVDGGMAHCNRTKAVRCKPKSGGRYLCLYKELSGRGDPGWVTKRTVIAPQGDDWIWVSGDAAKCSVTFYE